MNPIYTDEMCSKFKEIILYKKSIYILSSFLRKGMHHFIQKKKQHSDKEVLIYKKALKFAY